MKKMIVLLIALAYAQAHAAPLATDTGLVNTVTFDETGTDAGTAVTSQFAAQGVSFSAGAGNWYSSGDNNVYSGNPHFSATYLDTYSGGSNTDEYRINFGSAVSAAGAWFEFNTSAPAATFSAYLGGVLQETYIYNNGDCCSSPEFVGFTGKFDQIRISNVTGRDFVMDTLGYTTANDVPEPASIALMGAGLLGFALRRRAKQQ